MGSILGSVSQLADFVTPSDNMFRAVVRLSSSGARSLVRSQPSRYTAPLASRLYSHGKVETDEEFDARWVTYFSKPDIDAWELKKGMNTLIGYDLVPEAKIQELKPTLAELG